MLLLRFPNFDIQNVLISILVLTFSLSFHEFAHARIAYALGDDTAKLAGRLTLNPLRHLDPIGALCFIFARIGWAKPVPVNPARFTKIKDTKKGMVLVSLAGPVSNLIISFAAYFLYQLLIFGVAHANLIRGSMSAQAVKLLLTILTMFYISNIYLAIFNLLPVPPLDGYKIFGALLPSKYYYSIMRYEQQIGMIFLFLVFFGGNMVGKVMGILATPVAWLLQTPVNLLFNFLHGLF